MYTVFDVADWFLSKEPMTHKKLQKLCYCFKAWGLALYNIDLLPDYQFQAWVHGPANYELYQKYKSYGWNTIDQQPDNSSKFSSGDLDLLGSVWITYGDKSANELEAIVHSEDPWKKARAGYAEGRPCNVVIDNNCMREYYAEEYRQYQGV